MPPVIPAIKSSSDVLVQKSNPVGLLPESAISFGPSRTTFVSTGDIQYSVQKSLGNM